MLKYILQQPRELRNWRLFRVHRGQSNAAEQNTREHELCGGGDAGNHHGGCGMLKSEALGRPETRLCYVKVPL